MDSRLIFVIEDNREFSEVLTQILELEGYAVEAIRDGGIAIRRLQVSSPSLVLLDINLPTASGLDILRFMRADPRLLACPVVIITADVPLAATLHDQARLVLTKPIDVQYLLTFTKLLFDPRSG